jgi:hypothetical protein
MKEKLMIVPQLMGLAGLIFGALSIAMILAINDFKNYVFRRIK